MTEQTPKEIADGILWPAKLPMYEQNMLRESIAAAIRAERERQTWQPMETCTGRRESEPVLLWYEAALGRRVAQGRWHGGRSAWMTDVGLLADNVLGGWMPLPEPPR